MRKISLGTNSQQEILALSYCYFERIFSTFLSKDAFEDVKKQKKKRFELLPNLAKIIKNESWWWLEKIEKVPFTFTEAKNFQQVYSHTIFRIWEIALLKL